MCIPREAVFYEAFLIYCCAYFFAKLFAFSVGIYISPVLLSKFPSLPSPAWVKIMGA